MSQSVRFGRVTDGYEGMTISAYATGLLLDERRNGLLCPFCHGGQTKEKTLSLMHSPNGIQWKCWRASCDKRGRLSLSLGTFDQGVPVGDLEAGARGTDMAPYYTLQPLTKAWCDELMDKYSLLKTDAVSKGWMSNDFGHLVIPLAQACRGVIGHEFRSLNGTPKSRMNLTSIKAFPRNAIDSKTDKETVIIVEDSISALKVSKVCRAYSLQGTNLTQNHVEELAKDWPAKRYLLALDKDATQKAADYVKRFSFFIPNLMLCPLKKDLKYYYVADIESLVANYK